MLSQWLGALALILLCAFCSTSTASQAAEMAAYSTTDYGDYYTYRGERVSLHRSNTQVAIAYPRNHSIGAAGRYSMFDNSINEDVKVFDLGDNIHMLALPQGVTEPEQYARFETLKSTLGQHFTPEQVAAVYVTPHDNNWVVCKNEIVVKMNAGSDIEQITSATGARVLKKLQMKNTWLLGVEAEPLQTANVIHEMPGVQWAEPDFVAESKPDYIPDDPYFEDQWHLDNTGQTGGTRGADMSLIDAWDIERHSKDVVVTIFDDGIDKDHPDLDYLDGFNYINDPPTGDPWPEGSENGHGTACAGLPGAIHDNGIGVSGIAPDIKILPIKVTNWPYGQSASSREVGDAVYYAAENSDMGSVSVGVFGSNYVADVITEVAETGRDGKGWLFFKSSGNDGEQRLHSPGYTEEVISVGASSDDDRRISWSNWGDLDRKTVDFVTPGSGVYTTTLNHRYGGFGGTSASTPIAAGIAALILTVNPDLTREQVLDIMRSTCDKIGNVDYNDDGMHEEYGYGRPNAFEALKVVPPYDNPNVNVLKGERILNDISVKGRFLNISLKNRGASKISIEIINPANGKLIRRIDSGISGNSLSLAHGLKAKGIYSYKILLDDMRVSGTLLYLN